MSDKRPSDDPTIEFYGHLDKAFAFFNKRLFNDQLPKVMFELTNKKNVTSFLRPNKWGGVDGEIVHSIAINPQIIIESTPVSVYKCIVHEMARLKIFLESEAKELRNYHSKEWAELMEGLGLIPSDTGRPGGKKTGQKMSEYPIPGGLFEQACVDFLLEGNYIKFVDATVDDSEVLAFRNNLIKQCVTKGESLAEHYNNFAGNKPIVDPKLASSVTHIDVDDYIKQDGQRAVYEGGRDGEDVAAIQAYIDKHYPYECAYDPAYLVEDVMDEVKAIFENGEGLCPTPLLDARFGGGRKAYINDYINDNDYDTDELADFERLNNDSTSEISFAGDKKGLLPTTQNKLGDALGDLITKPIKETANIELTKKQSKNKKNKVTYQCESCLVKCWGKPGLNIKCVDCNVVFKPV